MKRFASTKVICPFYKYENRFVIFCQGIEEDTVLHLAFPKPSSCFEFKERYCRKNHTACPIHKMLNNIS